LKASNWFPGLLSLDSERLAADNPFHEPPFAPIDGHAIGIARSDLVRSRLSLCALPSDETNGGSFFAFRLDASKERTDTEIAEDTEITEDTEGTEEY
jgi:hypothetical protein